MPRVYRSMKMDADGKPKVVHLNGSGLGVRGPENAQPDVELDGEGCVMPKKGMSVFPRGGYQRLPTTMIPEHLTDSAGNRGTGKGRRIFGLGEGEFASGPLTDDLEVFQDNKKHGHIGPSRRMELPEFRRVLEATRDGWEIDEP